MSMNTIGVSQIMKNEAHILPRWYEMLAKARDKNNENVIDAITLVDTGSTDDSISVAIEMGIKYNIPTYVYERPFDDFGSSRNFAMQMAKDKTTYCIWLDIDEIFHVDSKVFDKQGLNKDIYMFSTKINTTDYTRNELWSNKKDFKWYGKIHEFIVPLNDDVAKTLTSDLCKGIMVEVRFDGASWQNQELLHKKYKNHATILEDFIDFEDRDPRWVFYTAQSWSDSACIPNNKIENDERLRRAMKYYQERSDTLSGYPEERYFSTLKVGEIMRRLEYPWRDCKEVLLKAYSIDPMRGESIRTIIEHYQAMGEWNTSFLYTKMAINTFHNMNPYPQRILFIDNAFYNWKILELHTSSCFYTGRLEECKKAFNDLLVLTRLKPEYFTPEDIQRINSNKPHILK